VVNVLVGNVSTKQLEREFTDWMGGDSKWIWNVRTHGGNQFTIRFPSLKKIDEISHFKKGFPLSTVDTVVIKG
jgi:hypothetical protein